MLSLSFGSPLPKTNAQTVGAATNFYVTVNPTVNGLSYNGFSPQIIMAQQGSQVNITVRNLGTRVFICKSKVNLPSQWRPEPKTAHP